MKDFSNIHSCPQLERKQPLAFVHIRHLLTYDYSVKSEGQIMIKSSKLWPSYCKPECACACPASCMPLLKLVEEDSAGISLQSVLYQVHTCLVSVS